MDNQQRHTVGIMTDSSKAVFGICQSVRFLHSYRFVLIPLSFYAHRPRSLLRADSATPDALSDAQSGRGALTRTQLLDRLGVTAWQRAGYKGKG